MMAKMFYTLEETKAALGRDDDAIKKLTSEGRLREFRDGPRLMYKADQVDTLKGELSTSDEIPLGPSDTGAPIGLVDSRAGSGAVVSLADSRSGSPGINPKEDTAMAADLGLSGSIGLSNSIGLASSTPGTTPGGSTAGGVASPAGSRAGEGSGLINLGGSGLSGSVAGGSMAGGSLAGSLGGIPSPAKPSQNLGSGSGLSGMSSGSSAGSKGGINILEDEGADPAAQTAITPSTDYGAGALGSGSGLLDLTQESDNTSLGAVLDEIPAGGSQAGGSFAGSLAGGSLAGGSMVGSFGGGSLAGGSLVGTRGAETVGQTTGGSAPGYVSPVSRGSVINQPMYVEARDPLAPAFGGAALGAVAFALLAVMTLGTGVVGAHTTLTDKVAEFNFLIVSAIGAGLAVVGFVIGMILGRVRA